MIKLLILLPEPTMRELRARAHLEDRPMSELIRRATEQWLQRLPAHPPKPGSEPPLTTHNLGIAIDDPRSLKERIYDRDPQ